MSVWPSLSSASFNKAEVAGDDACHTDPKGGFETLKAETPNGVGLDYMEVQQILQLVNV